jgi:hypothetical protein
VSGDPTLGTLTKNPRSKAHLHFFRGQEAAPAREEPLAHLQEQRYGGGGKAENSVEQ